MMKRFTNPVLGYLLFMNLSFIIALDLGSFHPIEIIEVNGNAQNDYFGTSIRTAGDINNDGYDDIVVGAYHKNNLQGVVYVIYGGELSTLSNMNLSNMTLDAHSTGFMITGNLIGDLFGWSVSSAGDINKDGYDDIIIGAYSKFNNKGAVYVIYGGQKLSMRNIDLSSTALDPLTTGFMITGNATNDFFGSSVSSAGDINKDGYDDIIIGAYHKNNLQGAAYVIYGGPKSSMLDIDLSSATLNPLTTGFMITGNIANDYLGSSVSSAGDINKDGYDDIIIGAYGKNGMQGAAYVVYGGAKSIMSNIVLSTQTLDPLTTGFMITGNAANDLFGYSVSSAGDINNDGYDDIIIGAYAKNNLRGAAYVVYGGAKSIMSNIVLSDPLTSGFMIVGNATGDQFGLPVGSAGDINKDGYDDIIIGAHGKNSFRGAAYVIYGGPTMKNLDLSSSILDPLTTGFSIFGTVNMGFAGKSVSSGDLNNDGCSDLIIGAYGENSNAGTAYLIFNKSFPTCSGSYFLYSGHCFTSCPVHTFQSNGLECQDCPAGCSECTSLLTCQACLDGYTLAESQCIKDKNDEKVAAGVFEGSSLAGAALGSGSSLPFNFGLVAKIIRNFKYMKLPVSQELYETFVSWKVASGFMSAPRSWSSKYNSKTMPMVFSRYGLQAAFMINFWKPFVMALIGIAVFAIFKAIEVSMSKDKKSLVYTISRQVNVAASNFALTQFYSNLDDVIFYFILEMRSTKFETGFRVGSSLLAIVLFLVGGIFVGLHSRLIAQYQASKGKYSPTQLEAKFEIISLIFKDFRDTDSFRQSFLMFNVIRSVVASLIFATLFEYPMIQISFLFVLNLLMIAYLWNKKSFKEMINTYGQMFCELILFIANICVFLLALFDHADTYPTTSIVNLGKCIIVLNFILLFGCAIFLLFSLGKSLYQSYLDRNKAQQPVFPDENAIFAEVKFKRPGFAQSNNQSFSSNNTRINASQETSQNDSFQNPLKAVGGDQDAFDKDSHVRQRQGISNNNYSVQRNQNSMESFDMSNSNVVLQSSPAEGFDEDERTNGRNLFSNVLPRSRLVRNRELTKARIAQLTRTEDKGSPESKMAIN